MSRITYFFLLVPYFLFSQEIKVAGIISDYQSKAIENAVISVSDEGGNTLSYSYSMADGRYSVMFKKPGTNTVTLVVSGLGYLKQELVLNLETESTFSRSFILEEKRETLSEVVISCNKKIKTEKDTTTISVASFTDNTEQTTEDVLKKLPGIEVLKDGSIMAHGKKIDKILIEGDNLFDNNYKMLSKNLDAKVLSQVQIIDHFEDNPLFKNISHSEKVVLNLQLKKEKQNIWFGNAAAALDLKAEQRKASANIGLLKSRVKFFYLADYSNLGEKASDQIQNSSNKVDFFGEDRYERTAKTLFNISSNENTFLNKTQCIFNSAFINTFGLSTNIKPTLSLRSICYVANDNQVQHSVSETMYTNFSPPLVNRETSDYEKKKILSSGELELKFFPNKKNYLNNLFIYKNNPDAVQGNLIYNDYRITQGMKNKDQTFYNHFYHTIVISPHSILRNYVYAGSDRIHQTVKITSPALNAFLGTDPEHLISQRAEGSIQYIGVKSRILVKMGRLEYTIGVQAERSKEYRYTDFSIGQDNRVRDENQIQIQQNYFTLEKALKYNFSQRIDLTGNLSYTQNQFFKNSTSSNFPLFNSRLSLNIKKTIAGNFTLFFEENNNAPELNYVTDNYQLTTYRNFSKGSGYYCPIKNRTFSFSHRLFNDEKRFSIYTSFYYTVYQKIFNTQNSLNDNFNFQNYTITPGGRNMSTSFNIVNYVKKIKLASKLETLQSLSTNPTNVNTQDFIPLQTYSAVYKYAVSSYMNIPFNFELNFIYSYFQTSFKTLLHKNESKEAWVKLSYKLSTAWSTELNCSFYQIQHKTYSLLHSGLNYTPVKGRFSFQLLLNNISNMKTFTLVSLDNYTSFKTSIPLKPRYLLLTARYRF